jgi:translation initiation factor 2 alpha subunit (eIF-2alpha)
MGTPRHWRDGARGRDRRTTAAPTVVARSAVRELRRYLRHARHVRRPLLPEVRDATKGIDVSSHADTIRDVLRQPINGEYSRELAARALLELEAENQQLRRERDDFEQRLHAYKSGEIV